MPKRTPLEVSAPAVDPQLQVMIADITFRQPIVTGQTDMIAEPTKYNRVDRQWQVATAASYNAVLRDPEARRAAAAFSSEPLNEQLPGAFMEAMSAHDARVARIAEYTGNTLGKALTLPSVPSELLTPDVRYAAHYFGPDQALDSLQFSKKYGGEADISRELDRVKRTVAEQPGISNAERNLVWQRYRYARDVKLIGLAAELRDQPVSEKAAAENGLITHQLESGIRLVATSEALNTEPRLFDPAA